MTKCGLFFSPLLHAVSIFLVLKYRYLLDILVICQSSPYDAFVIYRMRVANVILEHSNVIVVLKTLYFTLAILNFKERFSITIDMVSINFRDRVVLISKKCVPPSNLLERKLR